MDDDVCCRCRDVIFLRRFRTHIHYLVVGDIPPAFSVNGGYDRSGQPGGPVALFFSWRGANGVSAVSSTPRVASQTSRSDAVAQCPEAPKAQGVIGIRLHDAAITEERLPL